MKIDKSLILNEIKLYLNLKSDTEFANFLGIKPQVLSNWRARNTFDIELIYTKCERIDANWLLTGQGSMLKEPAQPTPVQEGQLSNNDKYIAVLEAQLKDKDKILALQEEKIADLEEKLKFAEFRDKKDMDFKIKAQRKEKKAKDEIILAQTNTINELNEENNALKSRHLPPDEPLQPTKRV